MKVWTLTLPRDELLTTLGAPRNRRQGSQLEPRDRDDIREPSPGTATLVWPTRPESLTEPPLVVVPERERRDFLAWASTYLSHLRPFTAFSRVLEPTDLAIGKGRSVPALGGYESAIAGLIMAEALAAAGPAMTLRELPTLVCESTFFFAYARALAVGLVPYRLNRLAGDWQRLRVLTKQPPRDAPPRAFQQIQQLLAAMLGLGPSTDLPSEVVTACWELRDKGELSATTWLALIDDARELQFAPTEMRANRERRVLFIDRILKAEHPDTVKRQFALGYLVSMFDGGANINVQLLPRTPQWSSLLLWHGLAAGLHRDSQIQGVAGGLGKRIIRDLLHSESILEAPRADISFEELEIFLSGDRPLDDFRVGSPSSMFVEIAPTVNVITRWPTRARDTAPTAPTTKEPTEGAPQQRTLFEGDQPNEYRRALGELGDALDRAKALHRRVLALSDEPPPRRKGERRRKDQ